MTQDKLTASLDLAFEQQSEHDKSTQARFKQTSDNNSEQFLPLAAKLRPKSLTDYVGQEHILADNMPLRLAIEQGRCHSLIFWGPPGTGKTTLAEIIAQHANAEIERISAVTSGVKEIRQAIDKAKLRIQNQQKRTLLFVDEVHRFNKSQQDAFLPHIEDGTIIFVGATTENPAFELNQAILSRARVYQLKTLSEQQLRQVLMRALALLKQTDQLVITLEKEAETLLVHSASGDARRLLNVLEQCLTYYEKTETITITATQVQQVAGSKTPLYNKGGDAFYDLISAFHKSVRGSDADAALYWYARILTGGGDPLYVVRRLLAIASEDIGNADPRALQLALNAWDTFIRVGPAEGERAIAQATIYMALAPKSNAVYQAFNQAKALAKATADLDVPDHLKNATSSITKALGHGQEYRYAHNEEHAFAAGENYFPEALRQGEYAQATNLYKPSDRGLEKKLKEKQQFLQQLNQQSHVKRS